MCAREREGERESERERERMRGRQRGEAGGRTHDSLLAYKWLFVDHVLVHDVLGKEVKDGLRVRGVKLRLHDCRAILEFVRRRESTSASHKRQRGARGVRESKALSWHTSFQSHLIRSSARTCAPTGQIVVGALLQCGGARYLSDLGPGRNWARRPQLVDLGPQRASAGAPPQRSCRGARIWRLQRGARCRGKRRRRKRRCVRGRKECEEKGRAHDDL